MVPMSLFYADILFLTFVGFCCGDVLRKTALQGYIDWGWWDVLSPDLEMYYAAQTSKVLRVYVITLRTQLPMAIPRAIQGPIIWCIDFCCGFQSRREACMLEMQDHVGCGTCRYIGLDIAAVLIAGTSTFVPDWCVDLLDYDSLPIGRLVRAVSKRFGLCMELLLHVFASSPCETNSRLQHSNSTRGGASRDTKTVGHPPLPVKDVQPMEKGFTTQEKHDLAVLHDQLEQKINLITKVMQYLINVSGI